MFELRANYHHDLQFYDDGSIVTLDWVKQPVDFGGRQMHIKNDYIVFISAAGEVTSRHSIYRLLKDVEALQPTLQAVSTQPRRMGGFDLLHTNTISILQRDVEGIGNTGDLLIGVRNLNFVFVFDPDDEQVVWSMRANQMWQHPHEPSFQPDGSILIFDNDTCASGRA